MNNRHYDKLYWIGFLNLAICLVGYIINGNTQYNISQESKILRVIFLIFSYWHLIQFRSLKNLKNNYSSFNLFKWFLILLFSSTILSTHPFYVFTKILNFLPSVIFVLVFINVCFEVLGLRYTRKLILKIFIHSYSIPLILSIFFNDNYYFGKNIYAEEVGIQSNNLAWAAFIVLASTISYFDNFILNGYKKGLAFFLIIFSFMSIINSGSRTVAIGTIIYLIFLLWNKTSGIKFRFLKIFISLIFIFIFFNAVNIYDLDSIEFLIYRTKRHIYLQENFSRLVFLETGLSTFERNPIRYFVGNGLFNDIVLRNIGKTFLSHSGLERGVYGYHNSYADIFFGGGIPLFTIFLLLFTVNPLKLMLYNKNTFFLIFIPLNIIAFTENSLPGGAYIFYPFFMFTAYANLIENTLFHKKLRKN